MAHMWERIAGGGQVWGALLEGRREMHACRRRILASQVLGGDGCKKRGTRWQRWWRRCEGTGSPEKLLGSCWTLLDYVARAVVRGIGCIRMREALWWREVFVRRSKNSVHCCVTCRDTHITWRCRKWRTRCPLGCVGGEFRNGWLWLEDVLVALPIDTLKSYRNQSSIFVQRLEMTSR